MTDVEPRTTETATGGQGSGRQLLLLLRSFSFVFCLENVPETWPVPSTGPGAKRPRVLTLAQTTGMGILVAFLAENHEASPGSGFLGRRS